MGGGTLDVRIMDGYPEPPHEAFLAANGGKAHGGKARNTRTGDDHLYIRTGDQLQFLDPKMKREVGIAIVEDVEFDPRRRSQGHPDPRSAGPRSGRQPV